MMSADRGSHVAGAEKTHVKDAGSHTPSASQDGREKLERGETLGDGDRLAVALFAPLTVDVGRMDTLELALAPADDATGDAVTHADTLRDATCVVGAGDTLNDAICVDGAGLQLVVAHGDAPADGSARSEYDGDTDNEADVGCGETIDAALPAMQRRVTEPSPPLAPVLPPAAPS